MAKKISNNGLIDAQKEGHQTDRQDLQVAETFQGAAPSTSSRNLEAATNIGGDSRRGKGNQRTFSQEIEIRR
ncbi:MAG: hypothetical protein L0Y72_02345 [Gemmataceae bacterium]|nr:hypothetical protein [Gemmataceae bacterium]MCI0737856.1 hypothetical protein [Gemmataceae bacterium]